MHLTASGSVPLRQQPKLDFHLGLSKRWDAGQATASPSISELHLLSFRRFLGYWPHHTLQDRGYGTHYQNIAAVVFHNCLVMLAVFGIFFWVRTCHFHLDVAGCVRPLPHLSLHSRVPGWGMRLTHWLISYLAGCVAATLISLLTFRLPPSLHYSLLLGCVSATLLAHTLRDVLLPSPFYARVHPTTCSPIYCQILCSLCHGIC